MFNFSEGKCLPRYTSVYYNRQCRIIYTTIGYVSPKSFLTNLSSKFDRFLAVRSQFDTYHRVDFLRIHVANPRPLDRFVRFIVLCFLREKN